MQVSPVEWNNRQRVFKKAAWYVEKSTRFENQETWVSRPDLLVLEFGRVGRDQQPTAFKALFSSLDFILCTGAWQVGSEFLNNLFGNSVEGGLKEKHWIGGNEVVRIWSRWKVMGTQTRNEALEMEKGMN